MKKRIAIDHKQNARLIERLGELSFKYFFRQRNLLRRWAELYRVNPKWYQTNAEIRKMVLAKIKF